MKKFLSSALLSAILLAAMVGQSKAAVFVYTLTVGADASGWTLPGVSGSNPLFNNQLRPSPTDGSPLATPTVLKFGDDFTTYGGAPGTEPGQTTTYAATPVDFVFDITSNLVTNTFHAAGQLDGDLGFDGGGVPYSQAHVTYTSFLDTTSGSIGFVSTDPNNGLSAYRIDTNIGGNPLTIWLDRIQSKSAPGDFVSQVGYINITPNEVPEPGSVAFLFGAVASGSLLIWRKRSR